ARSDPFSGANNRLAKLFSSVIVLIQPTRAPALCHAAMISGETGLGESLLSVDSSGGSPSLGPLSFGASLSLGVALSGWFFGAGPERAYPPALAELSNDPSCDGARPSQVPIPPTSKTVITTARPFFSLENNMALIAPWARPATFADTVAAKAA